MNTPILAIDVDGVLNRLRATTADEASTWRSTTVKVLRAEVPDSPFHRKSDQDELNWPVTINPELHRPWLENLSVLGVETVWATTWEHQANTCFAPFYGLGDWPVACTTSTTFPRFSEDTPDWKARCLRAYAGSRPLVWLDDMNSAYAERTFQSERWNEEIWADYNDPTYSGFKADDGPRGLEDYWGLQFRHAALCVEPTEGITEDVMQAVNTILRPWL